MKKRRDNRTIIITYLNHPRFFQGASPPSKFSKSEKIISPGIEGVPGQDMTGIFIVF